MNVIHRGSKHGAKISKNRSEFSLVDNSFSVLVSVSSLDLVAMLCFIMGFVQLGFYVVVKS